MCVVSFIGDHYRDKWNDTYPWRQQQQSSYMQPQKPSQLEFDKLKKEVEELKELLRKAKEYDEKNNEPHCEIELKMKFLREVAKSVGISLDDVIPKKNEESN